MDKDNLGHNTWVEYKRKQNKNNLGRNAWVEFKKGNRIKTT